MKNNKVVSLISIIILLGILILFWGLSRKNTKIENANNVESNYVKVDSFNNQSELNGKYDNLDLKSAKINMPQSLISAELEIPELFVKSDNLCEDFSAFSQNEQYALIIDFISDIAYDFFEKEKRIEVSVGRLRDIMYSLLMETIKNESNKIKKDLKNNAKKL